MSAVGAASANDMVIALDADDGAALEAARAVAVTELQGGTGARGAEDAAAQVFFHPFG